MYGDHFVSSVIVTFDSYVTWNQPHLILQTSKKM